MIPSNRTPQPDGVENLQRSLRLFQDWFRDQMDRNGFNAKTLRIERNRTGVTPAVHVVSVDPTDEVLRQVPGTTLVWPQRKPEFPSGTRDRFGCWSPKLHVQLAGRIHPGCGGLAQPSNLPAETGVATASATGLAYTAADDLFDDRGYHGQILPAIGPYPLVQDVSVSVVGRARHISGLQFEMAWIHAVFPVQMLGLAIPAP